MTLSISFLRGSKKQQRCSGSCAMCNMGELGRLLVGLHQHLLNLRELRVHTLPLGVLRLQSLLNFLQPRREHCQIGNRAASLNRRNTVMRQLAGPRRLRHRRRNRRSRRSGGKVVMHAGAYCGRNPTLLHHLGHSSVTRGGTSGARCGPHIAATASLLLLLLLRCARGEPRRPMIAAAAAVALWSSSRGGCCCCWKRSRVRCQPAPRFNDVSQQPSIFCSHSLLPRKITRHISSVACVGGEREKSYC